MKITKPSPEFQIVAHRGLPHDYPENTLIGYKQALMLHIDMLEIDIHLTKDQQLVVIHDDKINRTSNGKGQVRDYTLEELKTYDFGSYKDKKYTGELIPTLEEVLALAKQFSKKLLIEIKQPTYYPGIEDKLLELLEKYHVPKHKVIIQSFDMQSIEKIAGMNAGYELGVLLSKKQYWYRSPDFKEITKIANYANPNYQLVTKQFIRRAHEQNLKVMPYTVNKLKTAKKLIHYGVDGLIQDNPFDIFS